VAPRTMCLSKPFSALKTLSYRRHLTSILYTFQGPRYLNQTTSQFRTRKVLTDLPLIASETDLYSSVQTMKDLPAHHNVSQYATAFSARTINPPPSSTTAINTMECTPLCSSFHHPLEDNGHVTEERQRFYSSRDTGSQDSRS
jgi:hypothetical protein